MKSAIRWLLIICACCAYVWFVLSIAMLRRNDYADTIIALERMGGSQAVMNYAVDIRTEAWTPNQEVVMVSPDDPLIPDAIVNAGVVRIQIRHDMILFDLGKRRRLLVFDQNTNGYGTRMIQERIWYWGGEETAVKRN